MPPAGVNFTALDSRFQMICCMRSGSPRIDGSPTLRLVRMVMPLAAAAGATTSIAASVTGTGSTRRCRAAACR